MAREEYIRDVWFKAVRISCDKRILLETTSAFNRSGNDITEIGAGKIREFYILDDAIVLMASSEWPNSRDRRKTGEIIYSKVGLVVSHTKLDFNG